MQSVSSFRLLQRRTPTLALLVVFLASLFLGVHGPPAEIDDGLGIPSVTASGVPLSLVGSAIPILVAGGTYYPPSHRQCANDSARV